MSNLADLNIHGNQETGVSKISVDPTSKIICVSSIGLNTKSIVDAHFAHLKTVVDNERRTHGIARVLLDLQGALVNPPEVASQIRTLSEAVYRPGDRVAVINLTTLLKLQAKRVAFPHHRIFEDERQAMEWLTAP